MEEKKYFTAYMQALQYGSCKNNVIGAIFADPPNVDKSSIMRVFTQLGPNSFQVPTQVADASNEMVHLPVLNIKDRTTHSIRQIWDNNVHKIVHAALTSSRTDVASISQTNNSL